jgi:glycosyltransferase involved in cell wall biosynthesis
VSVAPRVTVVTATYNPGAAIRATSSSLDGQSFRDFEWVVLDGGSIDGTLDFLESRRGSLAFLASGPDSGIYDAWNKGVDAARGEWIAFLGAGDTYRPDGLERYVDRIDELRRAGGSDLEFVSSRVQLTSSGRDVRVIGRPWDWRSFRNWMCVAHVGSLHHRSLFDGGRRFDGSFRITGDYEFLLRRGPSLRTAFLEHVTAEMPIGGASENLRPALMEMARAKASTGARPAWLARVQAELAFVRGRVRRALWY